MIVDGYHRKKAEGGFLRYKYDNPNRKRQNYTGIFLYLDVVLSVDLRYRSIFIFLFYSFILSISVRLTPDTCNKAFIVKYSSFSSEYVLVAFSSFAKSIYLWIFLKSSSATFVTSIPVGILSPAF